jgi:hypothetical protein
MDLFEGKTITDLAEPALVAQLSGKVARLSVAIRLCARAVVTRYQTLEYFVSC